MEQVAVWRAVQDDPPAFERCRMVPLPIPLEGLRHGDRQAELVDGIFGGGGFAELQQVVTHTTKLKVESSKMKNSVLARRRFFEDHPFWEVGDLSLKNNVWAHRRTAVASMKPRLQTNFRGVGGSPTRIYRHVV
jgi:hypothetical protein